MIRLLPGPRDITRQQAPGPTIHYLLPTYRHGRFTVSVSQSSIIKGRAKKGEFSIFLSLTVFVFYLYQLTCDTCTVSPRFNRHVVESEIRRNIKKCFSSINDTLLTPGEIITGDNLVVLLG